MFAYIVLLIVFASMAAILLHERNATRRIEAEASEIRKVHGEVSTVHHCVTELAMRGETAMTWTEGEYIRYDSLSQRTDSMLDTIKTSCKGFVSPSQIDSLKALLGKKKEHLAWIMETVNEQRQLDKRLLAELPKAAERATDVKTVRVKKSGLAGLLGGKKDVTVAPSEEARERLAELNEKIAELHDKQHRNMKVYADSLRTSNRQLNERLGMLLSDLDEQTEKAIDGKEQRMSDARKRSLYLLAGTSAIAMVLLALLTLNIRGELKRRRKTREERERLVSDLQKSNDENTTLIEELRHSNDEKDKLIKSRRRIIQTVTHELRTPLTTIMGNAELITNTSTDDTAVSHSTTIQDAAKRMSEMTDSLLSYFRLDNGKETVVKSPFLLKSVAEMLKADFDELASKKDLRLVVKERTEDAIVVNSDRNMLLRIGGNLISNAIKFTDKGTVTLRTSYADGVYTMIVEDTGTGMDEEKAKGVFEPFVRLDNAASKQGFGLGLTIVKDLAELLGGNIAVESEKGKGCRFTVDIPMETLEYKQPDEIQDGDNEKKTSKNAILGIRSVAAIDDSVSNLNLIRGMLSLYGIRCDTCTDAATLTNMLLDGDYDTLITDIRMDGMSGYDILNLLKSSSMTKLKELPVVAMTAVDNGGEEELLFRGFAACLFKPFSMQDVAEALRKCAGDDPKPIVPDFSAFLSFGETQKKLSILIEETKEDMERIGKAEEAKDEKAMRMAIHKLGGTWTLLKVDAPLAALSNLLKDGNGESRDEYAIANAVNAVLEMGRNIVEKATKIMDDGEA